MIRRRRRSDFHEIKTGNERWLVSYADFITLLFAFFVVMYSVSQVSEKKYQVLSDTLSSVFDGKVPVDAKIKELLDRYPMDNKGQISGLSPDVNLVDTEVLASEIQDALIHLVDPNDAKILATEDWVKIELSSKLLFASASATPSDEAQTLFHNIAGVLASYDNEVEVSGYTDNIPIRSQAFQSNWELSSARASSIVRLLEVDGVEPTRLSAVGYGEHRPVGNNDTPKGREENRRVVLMVARTQVERAVLSEQELQKEFPLSPLVPANQGGELLLTPQDPPEEPEPVQERPSAPQVEPVRLENGGLLFSSDPELPR